MENNELKITYEKSKNYLETIACDFAGATTNIGITRIYFIDEDTAPTSTTVSLNTDDKIHMSQRLNNTRLINGCVTIPTACIPKLITLLQAQYEASQKPIKGDE